MIKRHKNNTFTEFEINVIKSVCVNDLFRYYHFFCPSENIWKDIAIRLNEGEKVFDLAVFKTKTAPLKWPVMKTIPFTLLVITTECRIFLYKLKLFDVYNSPGVMIRQLNIAKFESIDYDLLPRKTQQQIFAVPCNININYQNKEQIIFENSIAIIAEELKQLWYETKKQNGQPYNIIEFEKSYAERQLDKIEELYNKNKLLDDKYKELKKRAKLSRSQLHNKLLEHRIYGN